MSSDAKVRLGGLWRNKTRDGSSYLSGGLGQAKLLIFQNSYKRGDKDPDYVMYLAPKQQQGQEQAHQQPAQQPTGGGGGPAPDDVGSGMDIDDLPFCFDATRYGGR